MTSATRVASEDLRHLEIRGSFAALAAQAVQLTLYAGTAMALARLITALRSASPHSSVSRRMPDWSPRSSRAKR
jgi:hypothetical protein